MQNLNKSKIKESVSKVINSNWTDKRAEKFLWMSLINENDEYIMCDGNSTMDFKSAVRSWFDVNWKNKN